MTTGVYEGLPEYDPTSHLLLEIRDLILPITGTYQLIVNPHIHYNPMPEQFWCRYTLDYRINTLEPVDSLQVGDSVQGNLAFGATDFWVVSTQAGKILRIKVEAENPVNLERTPQISPKEAVEQGHFDTTVELYGPRFELLAENDDSDDSTDITTNSLIPSVVLQDDGTYVLAIRSGLMRKTGVGVYADHY